MTSHDSAFRQFALQSFKVRFFLLTRLPMAFISGLRLSFIDEQKAEVQIRYGYFTKNPFRSIYFACLSMAAELSTGALVMQYIFKRKPTFSMLVFSMHADFHKKATGKIRFECQDGLKVKEAVKRCLENPDDGQTVSLLTKGYNTSGECVASLRFEWTIKQRSS